jgi:predicted permease
MFLDSLGFAVNAVTPIVLMVVIGYVLRKIGFVDEKFAKQANKLVFRIFLPVMLFSNVCKVDSFADFDYGYMVYTLVASVTIFLLAFPVALTVTKQNARRGVMLQAAFRSNYALVGIPLAGALFGAQGELVASILSLVSVPLINVLAVISLTLFNKEGKKPTLGSVLLGIIKNPLIEAILLGILTVALREWLGGMDITFDIRKVEPIWKTMSYLSGLATPLALIALGAQFEFSALPGMKKEIITGVVMRCVIVPVVALSLAYFLFGDVFSGAAFAALVAMFATPNAVSTVPMTQEMGGDAALAGQLVVFTTLISAFTIFLSAFLFRLVGIF